MTNKLEQAARHAIHKINQATALDEESDELLMEALTALREALAEQAEQERIPIIESVVPWLSHKISAPARTKDLTKTEMLTEAVEAGFMLHTGYGQGINKMMPVSDSATLVEFARAIVAADRRKNKCQ